MSYAAPAFEAKIVDPAELGKRIATLPRPLVFTNGCFDILHRGHVTYLAQARALGASLIVAANSDDSVRRLGKGDDRPVNPLADRMALLASLESVTLVTWFDEDTPLKRILECRPDVLVKGGDWPRPVKINNNGRQIQLLGNEQIYIACPGTGVGFKDPHFRSPSILAR